MFALIQSTTGLNVEAAATELESQPRIRKPRQRYSFGAEHQVRATGERASKEKDQSTTDVDGSSSEKGTLSKLMGFLATPSKKTKLPAVVKQDRLVFDKTPAKISTKRQNDYSNLIGCVVDSATTEMRPNKDALSRLVEARDGLDAYIRAKFPKSKQGKKSNEAKIGTAKNNMFEEIAEKMHGQKPKTRRPMMALFTKHMKKPNAEGLLGEEISPYEWGAARMHGRHPGAMEPVEVIKFSRKRFNVDVLADVLGYLNESHLQNHAFGEKNVKSSNETLIQLDAVSTTSDTKTIARDYFARSQAANPPAEDGCKKRCPKSNSCCYLPGNHDGNCKFTPPGKVSVSTIERVVDCLTKGSLDSLAGLDDEDTLKGRNSIERLLEIHKLIATALNLGGDDVKVMENRIANIMDFHKTDFKMHVERHGERSCQCISCGLTSKDEPIKCEVSHKGPCSQCEESFQVYTDLLHLLERLQNTAGLSDVKKEQYHELEQEIKKCRTNLVHWRSHIVRKKVESGFSRDEMRSLKKDTAIVVSDFKMKILSMYFRENQRKFFGKRGTACLGFMVMTNVDGKEGEVDVHFFFFFSNDTTQDSNFVLAGKAYIYTEFLPTQFPEDLETIKVHFESDGAGAYNSFLAKACQKWWYVWTNGKIEEEQIRHSVNGDGKSSLDGLFGRLGSNLRNAVNNRVTDIMDADSCLEAYQNGAGIRGASAAILQPDREHTLRTIEKKSIPRLRSSHLLRLDREKGIIMSYTNSGYGDGVPILFSEIDSMFGPVPPEMPQFIVTEQAISIKSAENVTHSTDSKQSRVKKSKQSKRDVNRNDIKEKHSSLVAAAREKGVYICPELDPLFLDGCSCRFMSEAGLEAHMKSKAHRFQARNLKDTATRMASAADGILAVGGRSNRSEEHNQANVVDGAGVGICDGREWFQPGCFQKPKRASSKRLSERLKEELTRMFDAGEKSDGALKGRNKYTPDQAQRELRNMKHPSGLLLFSTTSDHGPLPSIDQIKSFWGRIKTATREKSLKSTEADKAAIDEWAASALTTCNVSDTRLGDDAIYGDVDDTTIDVGVDFYSLAPGVNGAVNNEKLLSDKRFVVDGKFVGGKDKVESVIIKFGGKTGKNITAKTDYRLVGDRPTKNGKDVATMSLPTLQKLLLGQVSLDELHGPSKKPAAGAINCLGGASRKEPTTTNKGEPGLHIEPAFLALRPGLNGASNNRRLLQGKSFLLNGQCKEFDGFDTVMKQFGGKAMKKLTKNTDYLVADGENAERFKEAFAKSASLEVTSIEKLQQLLLGEVSILQLSTCNRENYSSGSPPKKRSRNVVQPKYDCDDLSGSSAGSAYINDGIGASSNEEFDVNNDNVNIVERGLPSKRKGRVSFAANAEETEADVEEIEASC